jgi:hypothetical protein
LNNRELKLHFLKLLVNVPLRLLDRFIPEPDVPRFPQTTMLQNVYRCMVQAYRLDCLQGTFGSRPDGNFERLLRVSWKTLARLSEDDRYYRAWLGLAFLLAREELSGWKPSPAELVAWIRLQWLMDLSFLPERHVETCRALFTEVALCDYLGNLARVELHSHEKS